MSSDPYHVTPLRSRSNMPAGSNTVRSRSSVVKHSSFSSLEERSNRSIMRSLRRLSSLPTDFCCSICMNVFIKPSMLTCGHSFCAECIQHWLSENVSCPTCRTDTQMPIRNIALEQVVEEFKLSQQHRLRHLKPSLECESDYSNKHVPILRRHGLRGSRRRARYPLVGPEIIVDGPGSSLEAAPTYVREDSHRSLSSLPRANLNNTADVLTNSAEHHDVWESRRPGCASSLYNSENSEVENLNQFNRASFFRRSICAIRKSVGRRSRKKDITGISDNSTCVYDTARPSSVGESARVSRSPREDISKTKRFTWKKLFPFKLKKVRPSRSSEKCEASACGPVCVYSGFGRTFERINPGEEIAIAVFGRRGVGKTSLLDNATLLCEGRHGVAPLGLTERMRLGGKDNHMEYRFAHMTSMTVQTCQQIFVIDLIDAEFEDDHSIAHTSYMRAADAAILLYSCSDSASLLTALSIHRQIAAVSESRKPCVLLGNVIHGALQRYVTREMGEKTARNIRATYMEADLLVQDTNVLRAIEHLCRAVVTKRRNTDVKDICLVM